MGPSGEWGTVADNICLLGALCRLAESLQTQNTGSTAKPARRSQPAAALTGQEPFFSAKGLLDSYHTTACVCPMMRQVRPHANARGLDGQHLTLRHSGRPWPCGLVPEPWEGGLELPGCHVGVGHPLAPPWRPSGGSHSWSGPAKPGASFPWGATPCGPCSLLSPPAAPSTLLSTFPHCR